MSFDHRAHVHAAYACIAEHGLAGALARFPQRLRGMAAGAGVPEKYHETVTYGFLLLIADRARPGESFEQLVERCPELLDRGILGRYWHPETLASERARRAFVFPDRL